MSVTVSPGSSSRSSSATFCVKVTSIGPLGRAHLQQEPIRLSLLPQDLALNPLTLPADRLGRYGATSAGPMVAATIPRMTPVRSVTVRISHPLTARSLNPAQEGALNQVVRSYPKGREPPSRASRPEGSSARRWGRPSCQRVGSTSLSGHPPDAQGFNTKNASSAPSQSN